MAEVKAAKKAAAKKAVATEVPAKKVGTVKKLENKEPETPSAPLLVVKSSEFSLSNVKVISVETRRLANFDDEIKAAFKELFGVESLMFGSVEVSIEIKGVPTAVANSLRSAMTDEIPGRCLVYGELKTNDHFALEEVIRPQLRGIRLRAQIPQSVIRNVKFGVKFENKKTTVETVYSGDLKVTSGKLDEPIFDPTWVIAEIQPGKFLHINDITISEEISPGEHQVGVRGRTIPLDRKEYPKTETHPIGAPHADESGYIDSSAIANPRHHRVIVVIPGTPANMSEAVEVAKTACKTLINRLTIIAEALDNPEAGDADIQVAEITLPPNEAKKIPSMTRCILSVKKETDTIGNLLATMAGEVSRVSYSGYAGVMQDVKGIRLIIYSTLEVRALDIIKKAVKVSIEIYEKIAKSM